MPCFNLKWLLREASFLYWELQYWQATDMLSWCWCFMCLFIVALWIHFSQNSHWTLLASANSEISFIVHWKSFWDCRTPCAILSCSFRLHLVLKDFSHKLQTDGSVMVCLAEMCRGRFLLDKTVPQCGHSARSDFPVTEQTRVQIVFICKFHV